MGQQARKGDISVCPADSHGCPGCPHPGSGPAIQGSTDVYVNGAGALRVDDRGTHAACCGANQWTATHGSATVFINGKAAVRVGDETKHCGGQGHVAAGSATVLTGG